LYVAALVKADKQEEATKELIKLALANKAGQQREWEFNEWLHGLTGQPKSAVYQAWSAGAYLFASECVKKRKIVYF